MQSEARHTVFLPQAIDPNKDVQILIGPEGDFSPEEVEMAFKAYHIDLQHKECEKNFIVKIDAYP